MGCNLRRLGFLFVFMGLGCGGGDEPATSAGPSVCTANEVSCSPDGQAVQRCTEDGRAVVVMRWCDAGDVCRDAQCVDVVDEPPVAGCTAGGSRCTQDGQSVERCDSQLGTWTTVTTCEAEETCSGGACVPVSGCPSSAERCASDGTTVEACINNGWSPQETCEAGRVCVEGECIEAPCSVGETRCTTDGTSLETCDDQRNFTSVACPTPQVCRAGACAPPPPCAPGTSRCTLDGAGLEACRDDGEGWEAPLPCADTEVCADGACGSAIVVEEAEGHQAKGANDTYETAQVVPLDRTIVGRIGLPEDDDFYRFEVTRAGIVSIEMDATALIDGSEVNQVMAAAYTDPWLASNVAVGTTDPEAFVCRDEGSLYLCDKTFVSSFDVHPDAGPYTIKVTAFGNPSLGLSGADPLFPYEMRLQFRPGARLESDQPVVGQHAPAYDDAWKTATPLPLDGVDSKTYEATSYVWHYNDVDWLSIRPRVDGTLSWSADVLAAEDHDESTFNILMRARILRVVGNDIEQLDGTSAGDSPNCPHRSSFVEGLEAGERYLVRISALEASPTHPYTLRFEYTPGGPEDAQPGGVGAVDDAATAHDLGTATDAAALSAETWFWQPFDRDWFRFRTPSTPGEVEIVLDFTASHEALGYRSSHNESCGQNPHGIGAWLYLFDQAWFETAEQEFSEHLTRATEGDVPTQTIVWPVEADRDYYVLTSSRHNADRSNAYSVSVRFTPTAPVE